MIKKTGKSPFNLRLATEEDLERCVDLTMKIREENDEYFPKLDRPLITKNLRYCVENKTLVVYENNGVIIGLIGVTINRPAWWSKEEFMCDVVFYVLPEFRTFKTFNRMLSVAEEFAKINGLALFILFFTTKDIEKKLRMLQRRGYKTIGFWLMKQRE